MTVIILIIAALSVGAAYFAYNLEGRILFREALGIFAGIMAYFVVNEMLAPGYIYNFWIGLDILVNTIFWGDVETISARLGRNEAQGNWLATQFCKVLDLLFEEVGHCRNAADV